MSLQMPLGLGGERRFPSFDATMVALGPIPSLLYRALEFGTSQNRSYFENMCEGEKPRPHIREMVVRDNAKRDLARTPLSVEDDEVILGNEPLAALVVRCGAVQIRILKGRGGVVPGCSSSPKRRKFYNQQESTYRNNKGVIRTTKLNLVALWEFDQYFNLAPMHLALPTRAGDRSAEVLCLWNEIMPHPVTQIAPAPPPNVDLVEDELERLLRHDDADEDKKEEA